MRYYTGVGSRETPQNILDRFTRLARFLEDYTLRSGGADGADTAFEIGAAAKEIFVPWKGFNGNDSKLFNQKLEAFEIASRHHPAWDKLKDSVKKLMSRNVHQVLGVDLKTPSEFVVCWTPNGEEKGGTALAIRVAKENGIPVFNFGREGEDLKLWKLIQKK